MVSLCVGKTSSDMPGRVGCFVKKTRDLVAYRPIWGSLRPDEHFGAAAILVIEHQARTAALDVFEREAYALAVEVDAVVVEEGELLVAGREAQQPERNRHVHER